MESYFLKNTTTTFGRLTYDFSKSRDTLLYFQNLKTKKKIQRQSVTLVRQNQYILSRTGIVAFVEKLPLLFSLYRCRFRYSADHFRT